MTVKFTAAAEKNYSRLPLNIQKKVDKQITLLISDYRHPSLRTRKMGDSGDFEARIDIHYRFSFQVEGENIYVLIIGSHDEGLGKK